MLKQIAVFIPNEPGIMANLTKILMDNEVNIRAITVTDTQEYGILKIIVNKPHDCIQILEGAGYLTATSKVIAVILPDRPGALHEIAKILGDNEINIDYLYTTVAKTEAMLVMKVSDEEKAVELFKEHKIEIVEE